MIVNVSSVGGRLGIIHESAYCASKFALCGWSEAMAVDLHGTGISVKLIEPGPVDTEIWDHQPDNDDPIYNGPKFSPDEVAQGIVEALGRDEFEHYVPDMKAVVDLKNADIDTYIAGAARMARPGGRSFSAFRPSSSRYPRTQTRSPATWLTHPSACGMWRIRNRRTMIG
jgi:short-subunit dehydrogenase